MRNPALDKCRLKIIENKNSNIICKNLGDDGG